jgi:hypothetical protein
MLRTRVNRILVIDRSVRLFSSAFLIAILAACGGNAPPPKNVVHPNNASPSWPTLSWEDRHERMTFTVLPNMGQTWQEFSKTAAPTLTCRTCHGANAEDMNYKMPNPNLPQLDPQHMPSKTSKDANEARWATFMIDEVVPSMASLMDAAPYDRKTGSGFGCFNCHTKRNLVPAP